MAIMTFLANFDGSLSYQDSAGTGTLTGSGITYDDGFFSGKQGAIVTLGDTLTRAAAGAATMISPTAGAIAIRFRRDTDTGAEQYLFSAGSKAGGAANHSIIFRIDATDKLEVGHNIGTTTITEITTPTVGTATDQFAYTDWTGTTTKIRLDDTTTSGTRGTPGASINTTVNVGFGCYGDATGHIRGLIDCIAIFDEPLTTDEQDTIKARTSPWTWGMALSNTAPVVSAGSNATRAANTSFTRTGSFTDADSASWTATVDYDDGDGPEPLTLDGTDFDLSHTWATPGVYTVTVTVEDDGSLTGSDTFDVTITEAPTSGVYLVSGVTGTDASAPIVILT